MLIFEFNEPASIGSLIRGGAKDAQNLRSAIRKRLTSEYERKSNAVLKDLYSGSGKEPPKFRLEARWKSKDLDSRARVMADSLNRTLAKDRTRIEAKYPDDPKKARSEFDALTRQKTDEALDIISSEADLQATVDQALHTGAIDPKKAKVMWFVGPQDAKTCSACSAVMAGSPWSIYDATNYGAKLHPRCRHSWDTRWELDDAEKRVMRRRIRDGEIRGWDGKGKTPGPMSAKKGSELSQQHKGGWPMPKADMVRVLRRSGVPEETVNALLNNKQLERRLKSLVKAGKPPSKAALKRALGDRKGAQDLVDALFTD